MHSLPSAAITGRPMRCSTPATSFRSWASMTWVPSIRTSRLARGRAEAGEAAERAVWAALVAVRARVERALVRAAAQMALETQAWLEAAPAAELRERRASAQAVRRAVAGALQTA